MHILIVQILQISPVEPCANYVDHWRGSVGDIYIHLSDLPNAGCHESYRMYV